MARFGDNETRYVLVDLDHTLFDSAWRDHLINEEDWDTYHENLVHDAPFKNMVDMVNALDEGGIAVVASTTRNRKWRAATWKHCSDHGVNLHDVIMREDDDHRPAAESKLATAIDAFGGVEALKASVVLVIDDREDVCVAFRGLGIPALMAMPIQPVPATEV